MSPKELYHFRILWKLTYLAALNSKIGQLGQIIGPSKAEIPYYTPTPGHCYPSSIFGCLQDIAHTPWRRK